MAWVTNRFDPVGCGGDCMPASEFRTWLVPGGITRIVIHSCSESCS
jgi:hypothetical protein